MPIDYWYPVGSEHLLESRGKRDEKGRKKKERTAAFTIYRNQQLA